MTIKMLCHVADLRITCVIPHPQMQFPRTLLTTAKDSLISSFHSDWLAAGRGQNKRTVRLHMTTDYGSRTETQPSAISTKSAHNCHLKLIHNQGVQ
jgi:hypothetical protein